MGCHDILGMFSGNDSVGNVLWEQCSGNGSKLLQGRFRFDIWKHFFTKRLGKHWNRLLTEVVDGQSLSVFKTHLDNALKNMLEHLVSPEVVKQLE